MFLCYHCGKKAVIWQSYLDTDNDDGLVSYYECAYCGARITIEIGGGEE